MVPREGVLLPPSSVPSVETLAGTLEAGLEITKARRWRGKRSLATNVSAVRGVFDRLHARGIHEFRQLTEESIADLLEDLQADYRPGGLVRKMACFKVVCKEAARAGLWNPTFEVEQPTAPPVHTWYLSGEDLKDLLGWMRSQPDMGDMAELVSFIFLTGVRVEEALRMQRKHFTLGDRPKAKVPGTKTEGSVRMIPLSTPAAALIEVLLGRIGSGSEEALFGLTYPQCKRRWALCREFLGVKDHTCTLRSLRRSFAASMVDREMPIELISAILGHSDLKTTMGYLRLVGNFLGERARKWMD